MFSPSKPAVKKDAAALILPAMNAKELRKGPADKPIQPYLKETPSKEAVSTAHLLDVLMDPSVNVTTSSGFTAVYSSWGVHVLLNPADFGCKVGQEQGFECLYQSGNWSRLRRFDLPAMLEMTLPDGRRKHVALIGLSGTNSQTGNGEAGLYLSSRGSRCALERSVHSFMEASFPA